jgi:hypothetical protein
VGEIAEMVLNGILCEQCGAYIADGEEAGYPRLCATCAIAAEEEFEEKEDSTEVAGYGQACWVYG